MDQPVLQVPNISYDCLNAISTLIIRAVMRDTLRFAGSEFAIDASPFVFPRLRHCLQCDLLECPTEVGVSHWNSEASQMVRGSV